MTGTSAISGSGNASSNIITANSLNDTLVGGTGDTLVGGIGSDTYVINGSGVTIQDTSGTSTVQSSISYTFRYWPP